MAAEGSIEHAYAKRRDELVRLTITVYEPGHPQFLTFDTYHQTLSDAESFHAAFARARSRGGLPIGGAIFQRAGQDVRSNS